MTDYYNTFTIVQLSFLVWTSIGYGHLGYGNIESCFANLFVVPAAWIFYIVILFVVLILLAGMIILMVFNDSAKAFILGIIYSLL